MFREPEFGALSREEEIRGPPGVAMLDGSVAGDED